MAANEAAFRVVHQVEVDARVAQFVRDVRGQVSWHDPGNGQFAPAGWSTRKLLGLIERAVKMLVRDEAKHGGDDGSWATPMPGYLDRFGVPDGHAVKVRYKDARHGILDVNRNGEIVPFLVDWDKFSDSLPDAKTPRVDVPEYHDPLFRADNETVGITEQLRRLGGGGYLQVRDNSLSAHGVGPGDIVEARLIDDNTVAVLTPSGATVKVTLTKFTPDRVSTEPDAIPEPPAEPDLPNIPEGMRKWVDTPIIHEQPTPVAPPTAPQPDTAAATEIGERVAGDRVAAVPPGTKVVMHLPTGDVHMVQRADGLHRVNRDGVESPHVYPPMEHVEYTVVDGFDTPDAPPTAPTVAVYHGTTRSKLDRIREQGLVAPPGVNPAGWFMVTSSPEQALRYASGSEDDPPVVLRFDLPADLVPGDGGRTRPDHVLWPGQPHNVYDIEATAYGIKGDALNPEHMTAVLSAADIKAGRYSNDAVGVAGEGAVSTPLIPPDPDPFGSIAPDGRLYRTQRSDATYSKVGPKGAIYFSGSGDYARQYGDSTFTTPVPAREDVLDIRDAADRDTIAAEARAVLEGYEFDAGTAAGRASIRERDNALALLAAGSTEHDVGQGLAVGNLVVNAVESPEDRFRPGVLQRKILDRSGKSAMVDIEAVDEGAPAARYSFAFKNMPSDTSPIDDAIADASNPPAWVHDADGNPVGQVSMGSDGKWSATVDGKSAGSFDTHAQAVAAVHATAASPPPPDQPRVVPSDAIPEGFTTAAVDAVDGISDYQTDEDATLFVPVDATLRHVTVAKSRVMAEGLRSANDTGAEGLGGTGSASICTTYSDQYAEAIRDTLLLAHRVASGDTTGGDAVAELLGISGSDLSAYDIADDLGIDRYDLADEWDFAALADASEMDSWDFFSAASQSIFEANLRTSDDGYGDDTEATVTGQGWLIASIQGDRETYERINPDEVAILTVAARKGSAEAFDQASLEARFDPADVVVIDGGGGDPDIVDIPLIERIAVVTPDWWDDVPSDPYGLTPDSKAVVAGYLNAQWGQSGTPGRRQAMAALLGRHALPKRDRRWDPNVGQWLMVDTAHELRSAARASLEGRDTVALYPAVGRRRGNRTVKPEAVQQWSMLPAEGYAADPVEVSTDAVLTWGTVGGGSAALVRTSAVTAHERSVTAKDRVAAALDMFPDVTAEDVAAAMDDMEQIRKSVMAAAAAREAEVESLLERADATMMARPERRVLFVDAYGKRSYRRPKDPGGKTGQRKVADPGGEWDWYDLLDGGLRNYLSSERMSSNPTTRNTSQPDQVADRLMQEMPTLTSQDQAIEEWLGYVRRAAAMKSLAAGRQPAGWSKAPSTVDEMVDRPDMAGLLLSDLFASKEQAAAAVASIRKSALAEEAQMYAAEAASSLRPSIDTLPEGERPWDMGFTTWLDTVMDTIDRAEAMGMIEDGGSLVPGENDRLPTQQERDLASLYDALFPLAAPGVGDASLEDLYAEIVETARVAQFDTSPEFPTVAPAAEPVTPETLKRFSVYADPTATQIAQRVADGTPLWGRDTPAFEPYQASSLLYQSLMDSYNPEVLAELDRLDPIALSVEAEADTKRGQLARELAVERSGGATGFGLLLARRDPEAVAEAWKKNRTKMRGKSPQGPREPFDSAGLTSAERDAITQTWRDATETTSVAGALDRFGGTPWLMVGSHAGRVVEDTPFASYLAPSGAIFMHSDPTGAVGDPTVAAAAGRALVAGVDGRINPHLAVVHEVGHHIHQNLNGGRSPKGGAASDLARDWERLWGEYRQAYDDVWAGIGEGSDPDLIDARNELNGEQVSFYSLSDVQEGFAEVFSLAASGADTSTIGREGQALVDWMLANVLTDSGDVIVIPGGMKIMRMPDGGFIDLATGRRVNQKGEYL